MLFDRVRVRTLHVPQVAASATAAGVVFLAPCVSTPISARVLSLPSPLLLLILLPIWGGAVMLFGGAICAWALYAICGIKYAVCGGAVISRAGSRLLSSLTWLSAVVALLAYCTMLSANEKLSSSTILNAHCPPYPSWANVVPPPAASNFSYSSMK